MLELREVRKEERGHQKYLYRLIKRGNIKCYYADDGAYMYDVAEYETWAKAHRKYGHCQRRNKDE